jgi:hypothetical protein
MFNPKTPLNFFPKFGMTLKNDKFEGSIFCIYLDNRDEIWLIFRILSPYFVCQI